MRWHRYGVVLLAIAVGYLANDIRANMRYDLQVRFNDNSCRLLETPTPCEDVTAFGDGESAFAGGGDLWTAFKHGSVGTDRAVFERGPQIAAAGKGALAISEGGDVFARRRRLEEPAAVVVEAHLQIVPHVRADVVREVPDGYRQQHDAISVPPHSPSKTRVCAGPSRLGRAALVCVTSGLVAVM